MTQQRKGTRLRAVAPDEKPPAKPKKPKTITAAAESTERDLLVTMRTRIAAEIDAGVPPHTLAPLMRQLREVDKEIRALDARTEQEQSESTTQVVDNTFDASVI